MFLFFINDIASDIQTDANDIFNLNRYLIYLILFADDTVLSAKSPETLQALIDKLVVYCKKWNIVVNSAKTKVVVFRNGWRRVENRFYFDGNELETVDSCVYLGMLLHHNGKFTHTQKRASQQGSRALACLVNSLHSLHINTSRECFLFDTMISTVLNYASEIWGFHRARDVELVHNRFCRYVLNLGKNTPTSFLYGELGHLPMYIVRKFKIIKYWIDVLQYQPKIVGNNYC